MSSISNIPIQLPGFHQISSISPFALKTQQFQALTQTSSTSNFSFTTAEGDRISLSTGSESLFAFEAYNFQGLAEGHTVDIHTQRVNTSNLSDFSLLVEGDLNEQELADIQAFLQTSQNLFQDLRSGNIDKAAETALSLKGLGSLTSASLFFRQETTVSVQARLTEQAIQSDAQKNPIQRREFQSGQGPNLEQVFGRIRNAQEQFKIDPTRLAQQFPTILNTLLNTLEKPFSPSESPETIFDQIRKNFLKALFQTEQEAKSEQERAEDLTEEASLPNADDSSTEKSPEILSNRLNDTKTN